MNDRVIARLEALGVTLFRINLSHTRLDNVAKAIRFIGERTKVPLCLDSEGAQIRTGDFVDAEFHVRENSVVRIHSRPVPGDGKDFYFSPPDIIGQFKIGDLISIDFDGVLVQVIGRDNDAVLMRVINGGMVGRNKAVTVARDIRMPALTEKDCQAFRIGAGMGVRHFALSFANRGADVDEVRAIVGDNAHVISKIECRGGLANLGEIARKSDAILIDRGDLAREIPIEQIPRFQKRIIQQAKKLGRKVYVATNLLESMVTAAAPTRAEINDIYNTFTDGADGLVLAAETAVGHFPVECTSMIVRMIREFEKPDPDADDVYLVVASSLLVEPHGGQLVHSEASPADLSGIDALPQLTVADSDLMDCEQFALGTYSPLDGFMDRETLSSVLAEHRLPGGPSWTMPILLQIDAAAAKRLAPGRRVALKSTAGHVHALLDIAEIYPLDFDTLAERWFGTMSRDHPGVARIAKKGGYAVAGRVTLVERLKSRHRHYELAPAQTRFIFDHKGWSKVVGFHTRNLPHRAHEKIQIEALERTRADGLFISPVIGPKKAGDFLPEPIMKCYQAMLEFGVYPPGRVVLGSFSTYSRYCGPREAVFTALCRKNMGCSHFIVGRDHTGVGNYYAPSANAELFDSLDDLGIEPVFFDAVGYDPGTGRYGVMDETTGMMPISGSEVRKRLAAAQCLPDWLVRDVVRNVLDAELAGNRPVFYEDVVP